MRCHLLFISPSSNGRLITSSSNQIFDGAPPAAV
jgi:hypothetical protein